MSGKKGEWPGSGIGDPTFRPRSVVSVSSSASQVFTKWLRHRGAAAAASSDSSGQNGNDAMMTGAGIRRGQLFPARLALALGMAKTLLGVLLVAFGALALWEQASMSYLGSGLWTGAVVMLSGLLGIMAGYKRSNLIYIVSYLLMSVLALAAIGLLLIFAATGLARESDAPRGYFVDQEEGTPVEFLGTVPLRQRPVIVNAVLVALGTLSTIFNLAAVVICLREACLCYRFDDRTALMQAHLHHQHRSLVNSSSSCNSSNHQLLAHQAKMHRRNGSVPNMNLLTQDQSPEGQARAYRLLKWLKQSQPQQPAHPRALPPTVAPLLRRIYNPPAPVHPVLAHHHHPVPVAVPVHQAGPQGPFPSFVTGAPTAYVIPTASLMMPPPPPASYTPYYSLASLSTLHPASFPHLQGPYQMHQSLPYRREKVRKNGTDEKQQKRSASKPNRSRNDEQPQKTKTTSPIAESPEEPPIVAITKPITPTTVAIISSSDADSQISGYVYTGQDRDMAEEFILHSMTFDNGPQSLASSSPSRRSH